MSSRLDATVPLRLDGAGIRVALVDSGVDRSHPWLAAASIEHFGVERIGDGHRVVARELGGDASGHGTACAGLVHRMVPAAQLVDVRVLGDDGRGSRGALLAALRHAIEQRYDVVNLSLGIDVPRRAPLRSTDTLPILALYELADAAVTAGVVLVAAGPNLPEVPTYPGKFKSLVGVGRGDFADLERLDSARSEDHELLAPGTDFLAPALGGGERRWTGTSFATPFVTAHVARILAARPRLPIEAVKSALHAIAVSSVLR
jgi:subtilisin family serine protease